MMQGEGFSLPPEHGFDPDVETIMPYITELRDRLGIGHDDQGETVIDQLRTAWDNAAKYTDRWEVLEVLYGTQVPADDVNDLPATGLVIMNGGGFDHFLEAARADYGTFRKWYPGDQ